MKSFDPRGQVRSTPETRWVLVAKVIRKFFPGITVARFPEQVDVFDNPMEWYELFEKIAYPQKSTVLLDMRKLKFAYPEAVVYLAASVDHLLRRSNATVREEKPLDNETDEYLKVCGLRRFFNVERKEPAAVDPSFFGDCIPISRDNPDKTSLAEKFAGLIQTRHAMNDTEKAYLGEALGEIMGNALDHSEVHQWYRIGQIHPTRGSITVAIADNGVGVPYTLKNGFLASRFRTASDTDCLADSFLHGVSRYAPRPGQAHGAGLLRVWEFAKKSRGRLGMLSGAGLYMVDFGPEKPVETKVKFPKALPGTLLVLRIPFRAR